MTKLEWNRPQDQTFEAGLDRGVIYVEDGPVVAWSGLTSVEDGGESTVKEFYIDGIKYLAMVSPRDWKGNIVAYTYPKEFGELIGVSEVADGLYVDSQLPSRFGLSYRTMVSTPGVDTKQEYKIHLIYKAMASISTFDYQTISNESDNLTDFTFDLSAVPILIPGYRPSAHIIFDTREIDESILAELESIIYGDDTTDPVMPTIDQLTDLMSFGDKVVVVDNGDGTWTATGSNKNVYMTDASHFQIKNVDAEWLSDDIYRFLGVDGGIVTWAVFVDTDGGLYFKLTEGYSNIALDTDGIPYYSPGSIGVTVGIDTDGIPYLK